MPLDTNFQAEMYQAEMFLPSNNGFMRLVLFRLVYLCAVLFVLSDFLTDWYTAGLFSFDDDIYVIGFLTEI